ncbi:MAG: lysylphosphatidylglycerol synthase transmembrane domain-containing protein, partial [Jatrophihabitantaceae bacterium]
TTLIVLSRPRTIGRLASAVLRLWGRVRPMSVSVRQARVDVVLAELGKLRPSPRTWARGLTLAGVNWANDLLCLLAACYAVGASPSASTVLLAYAAGMAAVSSVPFLPGGLGFVEPALILTLVHGGVPVATATAGVLVYRLISFGLVAIAGWSVLLVTQRRAPVPQPRRAGAPVTGKRDLVA